MAQRIAFLVGNQVFRPDSGLLPLRGPGNDVAALFRILSDPERGRFTVRKFLDMPSHEILPEIERTLSRAMPGDLVLIYYSGHGKLDRNGRVCLATADTEEGALQATSIPARHLTDLVNQSDCDQAVLLLDCCYSGAVDDGSRGDIGSEMHVIEDARGFYVLTASTDAQTAKEAEPLAGEEVMGRFTAALVNGIESGVADEGRKGRILLSDLRQHLGRVVTGQTPQFFARRAVGDPLISHSPATAAALLVADVVADLTAESWHRRLGAVSYLLTVMQEGTPPARQAARTKLEQHLPGERDIDVRKRIEEGLSSPEPSVELQRTAGVYLDQAKPAHSEFLFGARNRRAVWIGLSLAAAGCVVALFLAMHRDRPEHSTSAAPIETVITAPGKIRVPGEIRAPVITAPGEIRAPEVLVGPSVALTRQK